MSNTSSNNTRIAKNTILLFPVCYLPWLYLCVQAVLEKCLSLSFLAILTHLKCRKSHVCKMYEILNKQVKFLTSQYIGTCKSAYTKSYALN